MRKANIRSLVPRWYVVVTAVLLIFGLYLSIYSMDELGGALPSYELANRSEWREQIPGVWTPDARETRSLGREADLIRDYNRGLWIHGVCIVVGAALFGLGVFLYRQKAVVLQPKQGTRDKT